MNVEKGRNGNDLFTQILETHVQHFNPQRLGNLGKILTGDIDPLPNVFHQASTTARKATEILLALQIERQLTKDEILELYVNKIYLGNRAYGFAAAAQIYFGKSLDETPMLLQLERRRWSPLGRPTWQPTSWSRWAAWLGWTAWHARWTSRLAVSPRVRGKPWRSGAGGLRATAVPGVHLSVRTGDLIAYSEHWSANIAGLLRLLHKVPPS